MKEMKITSYVCRQLWSANDIAALKGRKCLDKLEPYSVNVVKGMEISFCFARSG